MSHSGHPAALKVHWRVRQCSSVLDTSSITEIAKRPAAFAFSSDCSASLLPSSVRDGLLTTKPAEPGLGKSPCTTKNRNSVGVTILADCNQNHAEKSAAITASPRMILRQSRFSCGLVITL